MSELTAVLPKRRKRRKPTREEKRALLMIGWCVFFALWGLFWFAFSWNRGFWWAWSIDIIGVVVQIWGFKIFWPIAWNYIKNGYDDEH